MEITGNARLCQYVDALRTSVLTHDAMSFETARLHARVVDEHRPILEAIRRKDPTAAEQAMARGLTHRLSTAPGTGVWGSRR